jgi:hypothetical protein
MQATSKKWAITLLLVCSITTALYIYQPTNQLHAVVITNRPMDRIHDSEIKKAARRCNLNVTFLNFNEPVAKILSERKIDFILHTHDKSNYRYGFANYRILKQHSAEYLTKTQNGQFAFSSYEIAKSDLILPSFKDNDLKIAYERNWKRHHGFQWYPTICSTNFKNSNPQKIYFNTTLTNYTNHHEIIGNLNTTKIDIDRHEHINLKKINKNGIVLVLHSESEINDGAPSSQIFSALAAGSLIVADQHPFLLENFQESILFIDSRQSPELIAAQIDAHLDWIATNPIAAQQMAKAAQLLFDNKFSLEKQLQKLIALHHSNFFKTFASIKNVESINLDLIPKKLRQVIVSNKVPKLWALIIYKNNIPELYISSKGSSSKHKLATVISALNDSKKPVPDGYYLLSLDDGVHSPTEYPMLAFATDKELLHQVVLIPDYEALAGYNDLFEKITKGREANPWSNKKAQIFWRGSATGLAFQKESFAETPRYRFLQFAKDKSFIDAKFTDWPITYSAQHKKLILDNFGIHPYTGVVTALKYKYLFDIDGHSCSYSRMAWILASNSILMKHSSNKTQWYYELLQPYQHFIPIANDFSNVYLQLQWAEQHPKQIAKIIDNANALAKQVFNQESIHAALLKGFIKYHELLHTEMEI